MDDILSLKIIVVGDGTVGKSSLTQRFVKGSFTNEYKKTLGVDFLTKRKEIANVDVEFLIWDTAGQEYYDSITKRYYKGAHAALLVFSVENKDSFESISRWKDKVSAECGKIPLVLVMNKIDIDNPVVSLEEANEKANALRLELFPTSVKDNKNVNNIFEHIAINIINTLKENEAFDDKQEHIRIEEEKVQKMMSQGLSAKNIKNNNDKGFKLTDKDGQDVKNKKKKKCC